MEFLKKLFRIKKLFDNEEIKEGFKQELLESPKERISSWKEKEEEMIEKMKKTISHSDKLDNIKKTKRTAKISKAFIGMI